MDAFAQSIESWHDFYIMVGTAAATLLGLLFVGLSLNLDIIRRAENLNALAIQTFGNFVYLLIFAIVFLIPDQDPSGVGFPLFLMGLFGLVSNGRYTLAAIRSHNPLGGVAFVFWRYVLPTSAFLLLVVISVVAWMGNAFVLYWMIAVIIILLLSGARNSWDLLVRVHKQK